MSVVGLKSVISEEAINRRLDEIAQEINTLYNGKKLVVICVLKGGFMFFTNLVKRLTCKPELDFVRLTSYGNGTTAGKIAFTKDVEIPLEGKHVLIVEDIVDTGQSMDFLMKQLSVRGAESLRLAVLLDKTSRRVVNIRSDFIGFPVPEGFLVGYGLDYAEKYRELSGIYQLLLDEDSKE